MVVVTPLTAIMKDQVSSIAKLLILQADSFSVTGEVGNEEVKCMERNTSWCSSLLIDSKHWRGLLTFKEMVNFLSSIVSHPECASTRDRG